MTFFYWIYVGFTFYQSFTCRQSWPLMGQIM